MKSIKKLGMCIALASCPAAIGCTSTETTMDEIKKEYNDKDENWTSEVKIIVKAYLENADKSTDSNDIIVQTYQEIKERGIKIKAAARLIEVLNYASETDETMQSLHKAFLRASSYEGFNAKDATALTVRLNFTAGADYDSAMTFADVVYATGMLCTRHNIAIDDIPPLLSEIDDITRDSDPVESYLKLIEYSIAASKKYKVGLRIMTVIVDEINNRCGGEGNPEIIGKNLAKLTELYALSAEKAMFLKTLDNNTNCNDYSHSVTVMEVRHALKNSLKKPLTGISYRELVELEDDYKKSVHAEEIKEKKITPVIIEYTPIALEQYANDIDSFDGKSVKISGVPISHIITDNFYILKIKDEKYNLNCIYKFQKDGMPVGVGEDYVNIEHIIKENEKALTKRKVRVLGTLQSHKQNLLLDSIIIGEIWGQK